jgi:hypothetical protein
MKLRLLASSIACAGLAVSAYAATPAAPAQSPVLQQATSSVTGHRDKGGCTITHASNTRFTPIGVDGHRNPDSLNLVLKETFEQGDTDCAESVDGKVTVQATVYDADFKNPKPLWSFSTQGWEGASEPDGYWSLYRVRMPGCCGASDTDSYFSLWDGKPLFLATGPILSVYVQGPGTLRFASLLDNAASMSFKQASGGAQDAIAVVYLASDKDAGETLVLHGHKGDVYHYAGMEFLVQGKPQQDSELDLQSKDKTQDPKAVTGFSIHGKLECECDRPDLVFEIPVVDGHMDLKAAKASDTGVTFSSGVQSQ